MSDWFSVSPRLLVPLGAFLLLLLALIVSSRIPLRYNLRNLAVRWLTTLVTALAFTLVIFLLTFMLGIVQGMSRVMEASGHPGNVLVLSDGATDELFSNLPRSVSVETLPSDLQQLIDRDGNKYLASYEVYVVTNQPRPQHRDTGPQRRFVQVRGIRDPALAARIHEIELLQGRWFRESGEREMVVGQGAAAMLGADCFGRPLQPGDVLDLGPIHGMRVVGIMRSAGSIFNSEVWARDTLVQSEFGRKDSYTTLVVRIAPPSQVRGQEERTVRAALVAASRAAAEALKKASQGGGGITSVAAYAEPDYYSRLAENNLAFLIAFIFISLFVALGGMLGIMNTMFAAVSQRRRDIGVLRLLGYSRVQVLLAFLLEALLVALLGGLPGCLLGWLFNGFEMTSIASGGGSSKSIVLQLTVDGNVLAVGLLFTLVMGTCGGLVPALSAMRLRPLESLR
jgi:putative ABC transport system permease protein